MAVWAVAQLAPEEARNLRLRLAPAETDPDVLTEWEAAIGARQK
jgi:hypothetical protein